MLLATTLEPSPPVQVHELLTSWQFGEWFAIVAFIVQVVAAVWYVAAEIGRAHV